MSARPERLTPMPLPEQIDFEITNRCNLSCPMCPRTTHMKRPVRHMSLAEFRHILDGIDLETTGRCFKRPVKIEKAWMHMFGELFFNMEFAEIIDAAAEKIRVVGVSSNATVFSKKNVEALLRSKLGHLIISLDSIDPDVYEKVRPGGPPLERVLHNVKRLLVVKRELNPEMVCHIQVIDFPEHESNTQRFIDYFQEFNEQEAVDANTELLIKGLVDFASQVDVHGGIKAQHGTSGKRPCPFPFNRAAVHSNGDVVACCFDVNGALKMGNLFEEDLRTIWNNERYERLREAHNRLELKPYPICKGCDQIYEGVDEHRDTRVAFKNQYLTPRMRVKRALRTVKAALKA